MNDFYSNFYKNLDRKVDCRVVAIDELHESFLRLDLDFRDICAGI